MDRVDFWKLHMAWTCTKKREQGGFLPDYNRGEHGFPYSLYIKQISVRNLKHFLVHVYNDTPKKRFKMLSVPVLYVANR